MTCLDTVYSQCCNPHVISWCYSSRNDRYCRHPRTSTIFHISCRQTACRQRIWWWSLACHVCGPIPKSTSRSISCLSARHGRVKGVVSASKESVKIVLYRPIAALAVIIQTVLCAVLNIASSQVIKASHGHFSVCRKLNSPCGDLVDAYVNFLHSNSARKWPSYLALVSSMPWSCSGFCTSLHTVCLTEQNGETLETKCSRISVTDRRFPYQENNMISGFASESFSEDQLFREKNSVWRTHVVSE